jgi:Icc-related predicted phosphoesterase
LKVIASTVLWRCTSAGKISRAILTPATATATDVRIWILSDLHLDVAWMPPPPIQDADVCVVAGDLGEGAVNSVHWLAEHIRPHMRVVFVLGNHEFYHDSIERQRVVAGRAAVRSGIDVLDDMSVTIGDMRFVGATIWTDYDLYSCGDAGHRSTYMKKAALGLNDHRLIRLRDGISEPFSPKHAREMHLQSRAWIESELTKPFDGEYVVVTHHAPHIDSIHPAHAGDQLNPAFASDLTGIIDSAQPALWVHGHVHSSFDYEVGSTRVIANPRGYANENPRFDPGLVIDTADLRPRLHPAL